MLSVYFQTHQEDAAISFDREKFQRRFPTALKRSNVILSSKSDRIVPLKMVNLTQNSIQHIAGFCTMEYQSLLPHLNLLIQK